MTAPVVRLMRKALLKPDPAKRDRHGFRGTPPPASFSLQDLPDDAQLTEVEVAAVGRWSTNTVAAWRRQPGHPLEWEYIVGGSVRYRAGKVRAFMAMPGRRRGRPPKHGVAPAKDIAAQQRTIRDLSARLRKARNITKPPSKHPPAVP
jgi:hypothetical protein